MPKMPPIHGANPHTGIPHQNIEGKKPTDDEVNDYIIQTKN